jgi:hypothetical protein
MKNREGSPSKEKDDKAVSSPKKVKKVESKKLEFSKEVQVWIN